MRPAAPQKITTPQRIAAAERLEAVRKLKAEGLFQAEVCGHLELLRSTVGRLWHVDDLKPPSAQNDRGMGITDQ